MGRIAPWHIVVVVVVILLLFGANKLPDLARSVGKSLHILKDEAKSLAGDDTKATAADEPAAPATPVNPAASVNPVDEARDK